jgi:hypothetical protein
MVGEKCQIETGGVELRVKKTYSCRMPKSVEEWEQFANDPMRWYHKLPWWVLFGVVIYGLGRLFKFI